MENAAKRIRDDILTGAGLLTRLPLPDHASRGVAAAWAWPVVGLVLALIAGAAGYVALALGLPAAAAAVVVLTAQVICTGGLHEDGLADTADGLWGGWTPERRLEIMRDSRIGSYGVIALILSFAARWTALTALMAGGYWAALIAAGVLSRGVLPGMMALVPNARQDGLSRGVGRPSISVAGLSAGLAVALALLVTGWATLPAVLAVFVVAVGLAKIAHDRIGGQSGDILGAAQVLCEIAVLFVLV